MTPGDRVRRAVYRTRYLIDGPAVLLWLALVELGIRTRPLPWLASRVGSPLATGEPGAGAQSVPRLSAREHRRLRVIDVVGPRWPFCDGPCLRQALVAGHMLRRHGPLLRIGVAVDDASVVAHAWLEVGALDIGRSDRFETLVASPEL